MRQEGPSAETDQVPSCLRLTYGERPLARPGLNATGDPEDDEEEEEEEKKKEKEDEEEEENDGEEDEVPWQASNEWGQCNSPGNAR